MNALYSSDTQTRTVTRRMIGKCRVCKATRRHSFKVEVRSTTTYGLTGMKTHRRERILEGRDFVECCGVIVAQRRIEGHRNETPCDARCTEAKGHKCECSCGGSNHGAGHEVTP